jgi:zinc-ribbon domain
VKRCFYCGKQLRDESVTCFYCGRSLEHVSQHQQVGKKSYIVIAALAVIVACGIMLINKYKGEEAGNIGANAQNAQNVQKENTVVQAPGAIGSNPESKARAEAMQQRSNELQQQHQQIIANMREQQQQARDEMEERQKQQKIDMEIKQYEMQQRQNEINESNKSKVYQRSRLIYFETVTSK